MNFKVETLPNYRLAYVRRVGPYGSANIEVMEKLKKWAREKNLSSIILAIQQDNPETTLPEDCRFDACIVISEDYHIEDSICEGELAGGKYLAYEVKHTAEDIREAYANIFIDLQMNGYQIDNKPILERYTEEMVNNHYCEICVPIKA
ncbi:AraC family transcriptional regulator [Viridibacillus arvi]|uniref:AraC family transcriptional regulator n=1 Tax=Viridibacillus arvi TaxID=263475 RepID=UPI003CFD0479